MPYYSHSYNDPKLLNGVLKLAIIAGHLQIFIITLVTYCFFLHGFVSSVVTEGTFNLSTKYLI